MAGHRAVICALPPRRSPHDSDSLVARFSVSCVCGWRSAHAYARVQRATRAYHQQHLAAVREMAAAVADGRAV